MNQEQLGKNIRMLRQNAEMSQKELASRLQVSPSALCKWEKGQNCPDIVTVQKIAEIFSVSYEELLSDGSGKKSGDGKIAVKHKERYKKRVRVWVIVIVCALGCMEFFAATFMGRERQKEKSFLVVESRMVEDTQYGTIWELAVVMEKESSIKERFEYQEEIQQRCWENEYPNLDTEVVRVCFYRTLEAALGRQEATHSGYIVTDKER